MMEKPGLLTTEFWITLVSGIVAALVGWNILTPDEGQAVLGSWQDLVAALVAFLGLVAPTVAYIWSRTKVKINRK